jgi:hypothetical protein
VPKEEAMSDEKAGVSVDPAEAAAPGVVVQLPAGIVKDGKVYRDAEVVPMTGLTRKAIAREDVRASPHKITSVMILQCLRRIGPVTSINGKVLDEMLVGDRDFLMLEIRRVSMGSDINATVECEKCKNKIDVQFSIDELEVTKIKEGDYEMKDGVRVFRIVNTDPRLDILCRFPNGADQQIMAPLLTKNPVEAMFKLYSCCVLEWNGKAGPFEPRFFEGLPVSTLDKFEGAFSDKLPGPILKQSVPCPVCTADIEFTFQGSDFFFRLGKRGKT